MPQFSPTSRKRLETCDVRLQSILNEVIRHIDVVVLEGNRGKEAQDEAYRTGKSKLPWPQGKHNRLPSLAVDIAPYFIDAPEKIDWKDVPAFGRLMGYVERVAYEQGIPLRFGLDWNRNGRTRDETFLDAPHVEIVT